LGAAGSDDFIALAAGDSNQQGSKSNQLAILDGVRNEITKTFVPAAKTEYGKIPAIILLDSREDETPSDRASHATFSADNLRVQLQTLGEMQRRRRIVHLASHFVLKGSERDSYLLTESGPLSFSDLSDKSKFNFQGIWLVTLSACETGVGISTTGGSEVQSFASVADANGAMSTVASLWNVEDSSTSFLMNEFYANLLNRNEKGNALRQAQVGLLGQTGPRTWEGADKKQCSTRISHPYFWAPFVLIGNWR
jgi:CHAT domain-containing protein